MLTTVPDSNAERFATLKISWRRLFSDTSAENGPGLKYPMTKILSVTVLSTRSEVMGLAGPKYDSDVIHNMKPDPSSPT